jgi:hypothetical protein
MAAALSGCIGTPWLLEVPINKPRFGKSAITCLTRRKDLFPVFPHYSRYESRIP